MGIEWQMLYAFATCMLRIILIILLVAILWFGLKRVLQYVMKKPKEGVDEQSLRENIRDLRLGRFQ